ncbi:hypothetical protein KBC31_03920 [Candidatus Saccharibacteria bacterium]|nr:hypothetical protein [Candidatus Saccharibacteria bacterium]
MFNTSNSFGESGGDIGDTSVSSSRVDLEEVVDWASRRSFIINRLFCMAVVLGRIISLLYAEKYPAKVNGLLPFSTVVSGKLWRKNQ